MRTTEAVVRSQVRASYYNNIMMLHIIYCIYAHCTHVIQTHSITYPHGAHKRNVLHTNLPHAKRVSVRLSVGTLFVENRDPQKHVGIKEFVAFVICIGSILLFFLKLYRINWIV